MYPDERQLLNNDIFVYFINSKMVSLFRFIKIIYMCTIIILIALVGLYDNNTYKIDLYNVSLIYICIELFSITIYIMKIHSETLRTYRITSSIGTILRIFWIYWSIHGLTSILKEDKTTPWYYILFYVFISNLIYIFIFLFAGCGLYCCKSMGNISYDRQRHTTLTIVDDMSDFKIFSDILQIEGLYNDTSCSICFDNFENDEQVKILPCKHYFHISCINKWLDKNTSCPMCRQDIISLDV